MEVKLIDEVAGRALRQAVLRAGLPGPATDYGYADRAIHVGVFAEGALAGVASFLLEDGFMPPDAAMPYQAQTGWWRLRGMATKAEYRNRGIGGAALEYGVAEVAALGGGGVWCNGRSAAMGFYVRHSFAPVGAEFITPGTGPHFRFLRQLSDQPIVGRE